MQDAAPQDFVDPLAQDDRDPITIEELRAMLEPKTAIEIAQEIMHDVEVSPATRLKACGLILNKTMPDLKQTELTGKGGKPISVVIAATESDASL